MFDIRVGEFRRVWLMQLNVFLLILCLWIVKPIVNAQFLSRVGIDHLPLVFLLVAVFALLVSRSYSRLLSQLPIGSIMLRTYLTSIICLLSFAVLLQFDQFKDWMAYLFYIGVALFGLVTTSQFWLLANLVFTSLEAKRLFGFIGAGAIAGGISGGYVTSLLAPWMDSKNLLLVAVVLLIAGMLVNHKIWITFVPSASRSVQKHPVKTLQEYPFRLIRNSKHLTYLALIVGIGVVVNKLIEFQFSSIASARIQDPEKLTAFFGFWFSTANVVSLGIQLLITQRVVGLIGVGRSLFIFPGALFAGALAVLNTPVLWAGTTLKVLDISLKQSINKATTELLILPIPMAIKSHAKTFIDIFVDTTATGIGGIMLIFLINGFNLSVRAVCIMILLLLCLWIYFAVRVRKEYIKAFEQKIILTRQPLRRKDVKHSAASVVEGIRRTLQSGSTNQILFLLTAIEENKDPGLMNDVIPLLKHESTLIRRAALSCLNYSHDHTIRPHIEPLLKDPDNEVRSRAFACLLAHTRQNRSQFINDYLAHPDLAISGAALVGLATEARDNPVMQKEFNLEQRILEKINLSKSLPDQEAADDIKIILARAIGYAKSKTYYPLLIEYLKDQNPVVLKQAILSAGSTQDLSFVRPLLSFLPGRSNRPYARKALARYGSPEIIPLLMEMINEKDVKTELLIQLPSLAESMDTQQAIDFLFELIQHHDTTAKLEALEALHKIKAKFPHLTISGKRIMPILMEEADLYRDTLVIKYAAGQRWENAGEDAEITQARAELNKLLECKLDNILERIFWVLGLSYPPGIIMPLYKDIRNPDPAIRMNTLELLDNFLEPQFKKVILPIVETTMHATLSEEILDRLSLDVKDMKSCFELLIKGEDDQIKLAVLALIKALDQPDLVPLIQLAAQDDHSKVKMFAKKLLATE